MALDPTQIKIAIFDLDDTLFDTFGLLVKPAACEASQAMIKAGLNTDLEQCLQARHDFLMKNPRADVYRLLVDRFGVKADAKPEAVMEAGSKAFFDREIKEKISLFDDAPETLARLRSRFKLYLVTLGTPKTQMKKVELLKLTKLIDRIIYVNYPTEKTKAAAFNLILDETAANPQMCVSIGNRMDGEIKDAKKLGMQTILMQHGEFAHLEPIDEFEVPDARITRLSELKGLLLK